MKPGELNAFGLHFQEGTSSAGMVINLLNLAKALDA